MNPVKPHVSTPHIRRVAERTDLKSGLPGTPEEQRRNLRAAIKRHAETLRRLAR